MQSAYYVALHTINIKKRLHIVQLLLVVQSRHTFREKGAYPCNWQLIFHVVRHNTTNKIPRDLPECGGKGCFLAKRKRKQQDCTKKAETFSIEKKYLRNCKQIICVSDDITSTCFYSITLKHTNFTSCSNVKWRKNTIYRI